MTTKKMTLALTTILTLLLLSACDSVGSSAPKFSAEDCFKACRASSVKLCQPSKIECDKVVEPRCGEK